MTNGSHSQCSGKRTEVAERPEEEFPLHISLNWLSHSLSRLERTCQLGSFGIPGSLSTFITSAAQPPTWEGNQDLGPKGVSPRDAKFDGLLEIFVGFIDIYIFRGEVFLFFFLNCGTIYMSFTVATIFKYTVQWRSIFWLLQFSPYPDVECVFPATKILDYSVGFRL